MCSWDTTTFNELYLEPSRNGLSRPQKVRGTGIKMINMGEIFAHDRIGNIEMELVPVSENEKIKMCVKAGDLLFARQSLVAAGAGKCAIVMETLEPVTFESHLIRVRLDNSKCDPLFYYYYFSSTTGKANIQSIVMQVAAAGIRGSELAQIVVPFPPINVQRKIASILSCYDELIENNLRRIKILEEMAQWIYHEWFVHFRFPGHEHVKMVESELGLIPEGWMIKTVGSISEKIFSGGTPTTTQQSYWDGPFPWLSSGETRDKFIISTNKSITEEGINNSSTRLAKRFDIVVASAGQGKTRGQASLLMLDSYINQSLISIRVKEYCTVYILFNISSRYEELRNISDASSIRGSLTTQIFNNLPILLPDTLILRQYNDTVISNILLIENIRKKTQNLCKIRDLLLPRLISGELDLENLDIVISENHE